MSATLQRFERLRKTKVAGDISSVFASLSPGGQSIQHSERYADLKRQIVGATDVSSFFSSYQRAKEALKHRLNDLERTRQSGQPVIPEVKFEDLERGNVTNAMVAAVKQVGSVVVRGVVDAERAKHYKSSVEHYAKQNGAKGFPKDNPQVYELYWSKAQMEARATTNMLKTQNWINGFWHGDPKLADPSISLAYADRVRIRQPGDQSFALSNHVDGGGIERWEDPLYRNVYRKIFEGRWEEYDNLDLTYRVQANMNLHDAPGGCSAFRGYQGWLSLSSTGPGEGTLLVNPHPKEAAAYWLLRPFFDEKGELDLDNARFHGATPGKGQEFTASDHPELCLDRSMQTIPRMEPGDAVFWHADVIHAVEPIHNGTSDSSVFYIPAVPLCDMNARYIRGQREDFVLGIPPEDFPGGDGERNFSSRGTPADIEGTGGIDALRAMGLAPLVGGGELVNRANLILFS